MRPSAKNSSGVAAMVIEVRVLWCLGAYG